MLVKKSAASKRAVLPRATDYAKSFLKDWQRLSHSGRYDLNRLKQVMVLLITNGNPLPAEWKDHALTGHWQGHRECHVGGDFLLIYRIDDSSSVSQIGFVRTGTHSELFD
jgi:mRNA interferase YafQ